MNANDEISLTRDLLQLDIAGMIELDGLLYRVRAADTNTFRLAHVSGTRASSPNSFAAAMSLSGAQILLARSSLRPPRPGATPATTCVP